jgi:hypothetical protein
MEFDWDEEKPLGTNVNTTLRLRKQKPSSATRCHVQYLMTNIRKMS